MIVGQNRPRHIICKGILELQTSLHTAGNTGIHSDSPFYLDKGGRPVLRGTSIAGILQDFLYELCDKAEVKKNLDFFEKYFPGFFVKFFEQADSIPPISSFFISDAHAEYSTPKFIKDSNAINRSSGTSQNKNKFDYEIVPPGTKFDFLMEANSPESEEDNELFEEIICFFIQALKEGMVFVGAKSSAGLGRVMLIDNKNYRVDFTNRAHLKEFLLNRDSATNCFSDWDYLDRHKLSDEVYSEVVFKGSALTQIPKYIIKDPEWYRLELAADSKSSSLVENIDFAPIMIKSSKEGVNADSEFLTIPKEGKLHYYFPGSSLKGVFRSSAEYILNTKAVKKSSIAACKVLIRDEACSSIGDIDFIEPGEIINRLCPACLLFGCDKVLASSIYFQDIFIPAEKVATKVIENVTINRFTAGHDGPGKFNQEPAVCWEMSTQIALRFHHDKNIKALMALVFLILREAQDGFLLHGAGKFRGNGVIKWKVANLGKLKFNFTGSNSVFAWEEQKIEEYINNLQIEWEKFIGVNNNA